MDIQPTLRGILITLVPLVETDFDELYEIGSDPQIWAQHPNSDRYIRKNFERYFRKAIESKGAFKVIDNETKKTIGCSRFYDLDLSNSQVKIGYTFLDINHWGGNFNREMKDLMIDYAFESVDTVIFEVGSVNYRSQKALSKIGASFVEDTLSEGIPHKIYQINKNEWTTQS